MTGTAEHLVHALTRDAERTGKLGLAGARLVRGKQGAAEVAPVPVEALERVECLLIGAQHGLDFGVVCHARIIEQAQLPPAMQVLLAVAPESGYPFGADVTATGQDTLTGRARLVCGLDLLARGALVLKRLERKGSFVRHVLLVVLVLLGLVALPAGAQVPDTTPPDVTCATAGAAWHPGNTTIACTATDPETGIPNPADQAFDLTTNVPDGQESSNATTDSRNVCNPVPLCAQAGPINGIKIDRREPNDPTQVRSTDHRVGKWSRDRTITMTFNAASDGGSGVDGFSRSWTNSAGSEPDNAKDLEQGARQTTSSRLGNGRWFFHLKTRDNVGHWTSTVHRGPYLIDSAKPRVRTLSDSGKTGKNMRLRYRTADNNDRTREKLTLSKDGSVVERWSKAMGNADSA